MKTFNFFLFVIIFLVVVNLFTGKMGSKGHTIRSLFIFNALPSNHLMSPLRLKRFLCSSYRILSTLDASTPQPVSPSSPIQSLLICGPSGVGKGTLIAKLTSEYSHLCELSVSHTSRKPRPDEINGLHYHFITKEEFEKSLALSKPLSASSNKAELCSSAETYATSSSLNKADIGNAAASVSQHNSKMVSPHPPRFLETACVHGNYYGTREDAVTAIHEKGKIAILDLDIQGYQSLKALNFPMKTLYIAPPSKEALEKRLRHRGTEDEATMQIRIRNATDTLRIGLEPGNFDKILINNDLSETFTELVHLMKEWFSSHFKSR
jgi:guanylate kinase